MMIGNIDAGSKKHKKRIHPRFEVYFPKFNALILYKKIEK